MEIFWFGMMGGFVLGCIFMLFFQGARLNTVKPPTMPEEFQRSATWDPSRYAKEANEAAYANFKRSVDISDTP